MINLLTDSLTDLLTDLLVRIFQVNFVRYVFFGGGAFFQNAFYRVLSFRVRFFLLRFFKGAFFLVRFICGLFSEFFVCIFWQLTWGRWQSVGGKWHVAQDSGGPAIRWQVVRGRWQVTGGRWHVARPVAVPRDWIVLDSAVQCWKAPNHFLGARVAPISGDVFLDKQLITFCDDLLQ